MATAEFWRKSKAQLDFRKELIPMFGAVVMNYSDVKIGKMYFQKQLEHAGVECYRGGRPRQTPRAQINLGECMPEGVQLFKFKDIQDKIGSQVITETKGAFKDMKTTVRGVEYVFGTGGIHASVSNRIYRSSDKMMIVDVDVTSLYPSIAITRGYYPEHLGEKFVEVYRNLLEERMHHAKGTPKNAMLKLALNGVYGASNDKYSIFYDPMFTMKITIGGQMMMAELIENLLAIPYLEVIQANTDGVTVYMTRGYKDLFDAACSRWEEKTRLHLEQVEYDLMAIADVNSYIARTVDGKVKRKGRYEYDVEWHQNASALVVPKVAEKVILEGANAVEEVERWPDKMDFMLRAKVPSTSILTYEVGDQETVMPNLQRYYLSKAGGNFVKTMPPLPKKPDEWRRIAIQSGRTVFPCNNIESSWMPIDHSWYIEEVLKLTEELEDA
jgi:hypothetical protein